MSKRHYNLIFGFGQACGCSITLRKAALQHLSFPGDWTAPIYEAEGYPRFVHDLINRVDTLLDPPADFFDPKDFISNAAVSNTGKQVYINPKTRYILNHDFPIGCDFETEIQKVAARYRKRREKLFQLIERSERVLVVRMDIPGGEYPASLDDCRYARKRLSERFPKTRFDALLVSYDKSISFERREFKEVEPGLFQLAFDFYDHEHPLPNQPKAAVVAAALNEHFSVDDYRTEEEKAFNAAKSRAEKQEKRRLRRIKHLVPFKKFWHGKFNFLDTLLARKRRQIFEQIAILGFNCEPAFRFYRKWGFVDSSLFAWANSGDLMQLVRTFENLDLIGSKDFEFHEPSRMWLCKATGNYFHGKMKAHAGDPAPTAEELAADKADLVARLEHLKRKLVNYLTNDKSTLLVYRLGDEAGAPALANKLIAFEKALAKLGAKNCKLLIVCERAHLHLMPQGENRIFRAVNKFNPSEDVTSRKKGDGAGWNRIYSEFAPAVIKAKTHTFKFEDV